MAVWNSLQRVARWLKEAVKNWWQRAAPWLKHPRSKILIVVVVAVALAALTVLLWPTIQRALLPGADNLSGFWVAVIVAGTFSVAGLLVYFVAEDKRLWDLLQLLIVPLVLVVIGLWFTAQQDARQRQIEEQRAQDAAGVPRSDEPAHTRE